MLSGGGVQRSTLQRVMSAATTNATSVKASPGVVTGLHLYNTSAAAKFVKFYNKASAPVVGTDVPILTVPLAATPNGRVDTDGMSLSFSIGIAYAITGAVADTDTTATAVNDVVGGLLYQ